MSKKKDTIAIEFHDTKQKKNPYISMLRRSIKRQSLAFESLQHLNWNWREKVFTERFFLVIVDRKSH